jgi:hypothetical protein
LINVNFYQSGELDWWYKQVPLVWLFVRGNDVKQGSRAQITPTLQKALVKNEGFLYAV